MSKGGPVFAVSSGLKRIPHLVSIVPFSDMRCRRSIAAGPYSPSMLYGLAGKVPKPSVLLIACPYAYEPLSEILPFTFELTFTSNWFWLYRPDDSIRMTRPRLPNG